MVFYVVIQRNNNISRAIRSGVVTMWSSPFLSQVSSLFKQQTLLCWLHLPSTRINNGLEAQSIIHLQSGPALDPEVFRVQQIQDVYHSSTRRTYLSKGFYLIYFNKYSERNLFSLRNGERGNEWGFASKSYRKIRRVNRRFPK